MYSLIYFPDTQREFQGCQLIEPTNCLFISFLPREGESLMFLAMFHSYIVHTTVTVDSFLRIEVPYLIMMGILFETTHMKQTCSFETYPSSPANLVRLLSEKSAVDC